MLQLLQGPQLQFTGSWAISFKAICNLKSEVVHPYFQNQIYKSAAPNLLSQMLELGGSIETMAFSQGLR